MLIIMAFHIIIQDRTPYPILVDMICLLCLPYYNLYEPDTL